MTRQFTHRTSTLAILGVASVLGSALPCAGDVALPSLISDNMVLQQRAKVDVWGKADPGESVTVQLGPEQGQVTAGKDGSWGVKLGGIKSGGPYDMTISGKNSITIHNVAVGEVWVAAGESNMEYKLIAAHNGPAELADASLPMVRVFVLKHHAAEKPETDCDGSWVVCNPDTARNFSAVGFFFGKELNRGMHLPVGIIQSAWGPSPAQAWTPRAVLEKAPALHAALDRYEAAATAYPQAEVAYEQKLADWKAASTSGSAAGSPAQRSPIPPLNPAGAREPGALFNGMISPLLRYPVRGVLWYQGETDTADAALYRELFPAMIAAWRKAWGETEFPFLYVQLPGFLAKHAEPSESRWAELREAQASALSQPKTGMAVTIDLGEEHNMHPANKQEVAHRLTLIAQAEVYGKSGVASSGPVFTGMEIADGKAVLSFSHNEGLNALGGPIKGLAIAGADGQFVWADAQIHNGKVIAQSKDVPKPVAVRYDWADMPEGNLFNEAGLPAAPLRTDDWVAGQAVPSATPEKHAKRHGG